MFGWLKPKRTLFRYWDGAKRREADPLELWARMIDNPLGNIDEEFTAAYEIPLPITEDQKVLHNHLKMQVRAKKHIGEMICHIFQVKPFQEGQRGLTYLELETLYGKFHEFMAALKKKHAPQPISSAPSDSNGSADKSPTTSASASISTSDESNDSETIDSSMQSVTL